MFFGNGFSRSLVFAPNCFENRIDSDGQASLVVVGSKSRFDLEFGYVETGGIWKRAFQTVTDLDKHFAVLNEDEEDGSIAPLLLTHAPCLRDTLRVIGDIRVALHLREDRDHDLVRRFALKLGELFVETQPGFF